MVATAPLPDLLAAAASAGAAGALALPCDLDELLAALADLTRPAPVPAKDERDELARRRYLRRLAGELTTLRAATARAAAAAALLAAREHAGARAPADAARRRALGRAIEQLRLQLGHYAREYEALRAHGAPGGGGGVGP